LAGTFGAFAVTNWLSDRITEAISMHQAEPTSRPSNQWVGLMMDVAAALNLPVSTNSVQLYSARASDLLSSRDPLADAGGMISTQIGAKILRNGQVRPDPGFVVATKSGELALVRRNRISGIEVFGSRSLVPAADIQWLADLNGVVLRPAADDTRGAQALPPIPWCSSSKNPVEVLGDIAKQYEETRQKMPSGDPRTVHMTDLITAAMRCQQYVQNLPAADGYFRGFQNERDGLRIVALGLAEADPKGKIRLAIEAIRDPRSAFEQFHGLVLAQQLIQTASPSERDAVRAAISGQIGKTITLGDMSRWQPAQELLKYLSGAVPGREPLRIAVTPGNPPSFHAAGGAGPYKWHTRGSLPPGFSLTDAGEIVGSCETPGTFSFSVIVLDARGETVAADGRIDCGVRTGAGPASDGPIRGELARTDARQSDLRISAVRQSGDAGQPVTLYAQYTCNDLCRGGFLEGTLISPDGQRVKVNDRLTLSSGTLDVSLVVLNTADFRFQSDRIEVCLVNDQTRRSLLCSTIPFVHTWASISEGGRLIAPGSGPLLSQTRPVLVHVVDVTGGPAIRASVTMRRFTTSEILSQKLTTDLGTAEFNLGPGHYLISAESSSGSGQAEVTSARDNVEVTITLIGSGKPGSPTSGAIQSVVPIQQSRPPNSTASLPGNGRQSSPSGRAWTNLLTKCAGIKLTSGFIFLGVSNTVGPGSIWRLDSDKSLRLQWETADIASGGKLPSNLIVASAMSSCKSADAQLVLSLLPADLSARDVSNVRIDLHIGLDRLNESAFMSLFRTGAVSQAYSEDLRAPGRLVMSEAVKVSAVSISVVLNSRLTTRTKAVLSSGLGGPGLTYDWSSDTNLNIRSQQDFYVVGNFSQANLGAK
jgi:hypothetical protein